MHFERKKKINTLLMTSSDNSDGAQNNTFDIKTNASYDATFLCMAESSDHNLRS